MNDQKYRYRIKYGEIEFEVEGDKEFVEKHIEKFRNERQKIVNELQIDEINITSKTSKEISELKNLSLSEFYKQKQPNSHNENIIVFAYWLMKKENKKDFTTKDILNCYDTVKISKPKNIYYHLRNLISAKKALLISGSKKGSYSITLMGIEFVEKKLSIKGHE
ncbi:MAG: hypothetical protein ACTSRP_13120 [Candidatus Helarchaeota archaeon]